MKEMQTTVGNMAHRFAWGYEGQEPYDAYREAVTELYDELYEKWFIEYTAIAHGAMMRAEVVGVPDKNATIEQMEATEIEILPVLIEA